MVKEWGWFLRSPEEKTKRTKEEFQQSKLYRIRSHQTINFASTFAFTFMYVVTCDYALGTLYSNSVLVQYSDKLFLFMTKLASFFYAFVMVKLKYTSYR